MLLYACTYVVGQYVYIHMSHADIHTYLWCADNHSLIASDTWASWKNTQRYTYTHNAEHGAVVLQVGRSDCAQAALLHMHMICVENGETLQTSVYNELMLAYAVSLLACCCAYPSHIHICVCIYICIHTYIHTYEHAYMHIYTLTFLFLTAACLDWTYLYCSYLIKSFMPLIYPTRRL